MSVGSVKYLYKYVYKGLGAKCFPKQPPLRVAAALEYNWGEIAASPAERNSRAKRYGRTTRCTTVAHHLGRTLPDSFACSARRKQTGSNEHVCATDRTMMKVQESTTTDAAAPEPELQNEIDRYEDARTLGACEACWRTFGFPLYRSSPPVMGLAVHDEDMQRVMWVEGTERERVDEDPPPTTLTTWMSYVGAPPSHDEGCRDLKYQDFPDTHTYSKVRPGTNVSRACASSRFLRQ